VPPVVFDATTSLVFRRLLHAPLLPGAAWCLVWVVRAGRRAPLSGRAAAALVLMGWSLVFLRPTLGAFTADAANVRARFVESDPYSALYDAVAALPAGNHILADPFTSYQLSARTSMRFVALFQQHANPADPTAVARLAAVRDALSPFVLPVTAAEVCREYDIDYVVLSGIARPAGADFLSPGAPVLFEPALQRLRSMPEVFRETARGARFAIFRFDPHGVAENRWNGIDAPVRFAATPPASCPVPVPGNVFEITGVSLDAAVAAPGDSIYLTFGYRRNMAAPYGNPLEMHVRFDRRDVLESTPYPGDKFVRRFEERRVHQVRRYRADVFPGHGLIEPDLWPIGTPLVETFGLRLPETLAPGEYAVQVKVSRRTLLPNFALRDVLFNRDHYSGEACATLRVSGPGEAR
jgi:hypothetical protein